MKIIQICHSLRRGGAERLVLQLTNAYEKSGHQIFIITLEDKNEYGDLSKGISIQPLSIDGLGKWPYCVPRFVMRLRDVIKKINPDVIECHLRTDCLVTAFGRSDIPTVRVFHSRVSEGRWRYAESLSTRLIGGHSIAVSESVRSDVEKKLFLRNVTTITNGIDIDLFPFYENKIRSSGPVIGVLGTICWTKRPDLALNAFAQLTRNFPNATLKFIGEGPLKDKTVSMAQERGLADRVLFAGQVAEVSRALEGVNVLWQLSEHEGLPLSIAEAMSSGIPAVGHDVMGICDVIVDGVTGYLVPKENINMVVEKTETLLSSSELLIKFSNAARYHVEEKFNINRMADEHLNILQRVVLQNNKK